MASELVFATVLDMALMIEVGRSMGRSMGISMALDEHGDGAAVGDDDKLDDEFVLFVYNLET